MSSSLTIFTDCDGPRLRYVAQVIFHFHLNVEYRILQLGTNANPGEATLYYSKDKPAEDQLYIPASGFLAASKIEVIETPVLWQNAVPLLFPLAGTGESAFDLFSAVFWCLSRYEEYLPHQADEHGRFQPKSSLASREGFLQLPVVDIWISMLRDRLLKHFPALNLEAPQSEFVPTIDVDQAFSIKGKGLIRTAGGMVRDLLKNPANVSNRLKVLAGLKPDPYDNFDYLDHQFEKYRLRPVFFVQVGKTGKFDKNLDPQSTQMRKILSRLNKYQVGLHPSYRSHNEPRILKQEKEQLEVLLQKPVRMSRQHFLRMKLPETCRELAAAGIEEDYTMGYAAETGFRAGTAKPFPFYDLEKEKQEKLMIHPFCVMDVTCRHYLELTPAQASERVQMLMQQVQRSGGTFISLWHNETLSETGIWSRWRKIFETMLAEGSAMNHRK
ncbi:MAG: polysaccharide deacetylase family protein [Bacteroidia bacterium]